MRWPLALNVIIHQLQRSFLCTAVIKYFSCVFACPLFRETFSPRVMHRVALKSVIGAGIRKISYVDRLTIILLLGGGELCWKCLTS